MPIKIKSDFGTRLDEPKMYFVYMLNDEYISWEFCIRIIMGVFHKSLEEADAITHDIQTRGEGLCGVFMFEIAETKARMVEKQARKERFPMQCLVEEV
jgi:ATP-dependent Clp protease adaptor protein ClpS